MNRAEDHLAKLDSGRDHQAHAAFTRLVKEANAPLHSNDLRPLLTWMCAELDELYARMDKLKHRQDPDHHNPPVDPTGTDPEPA